MTGQPFSLDLDLARLLAEEPFVRRLARGLLFDEHRVDDVVQQTWLAALREPPRQAGALRGWLATVVARLAANEVRGRLRRERRELRAVAQAASDAAHLSAHDVLAREERRRELVDALTALPDPYRSVVALRYLEGLEPVEIARRMNAPDATVRTWLRRGLERMRGTLDERYGGDRGAWCTALLPLARGRDAATAGMATTLVTLGALAVQKPLFFANDLSA
jgi:RNA polymerase sigma factor (sigma-70 family)